MILEYCPLRVTMNMVTHSTIQARPVGSRWWRARVTATYAMRASASSTGWGTGRPWALTSSVSAGGMKSGAMRPRAHSRPLALWAVETGDLGRVFGNELVDGLKDGLGAVLVDEVGERLQIASGGVVLGKVAQCRPGGEQHEFEVMGAASLDEVAGGPRQGAQRVTAAD
ncbi:hypothetical protein [Streptomyces sp. HB2AG]|uniref:hypothetical protein n=1 Tax=Streptomyces sp. HB2AG TaxID=2983400 RepID=UPI003FA693AA